MDDHKEMISFGAGVNSVAMTILLVNEGWRGHIVFADPGSEHPDTECYIPYFQKWLAPHGLKITTIMPGFTPQYFGSAYQKTLLQKCTDDQIVPMVTMRWCTDQYKRRPLHRWAAEHEIATILLGISLEESHRSYASQRESLNIEFPLIDRGIDRQGCKDIIAGAGLSIPPKSGCWFCPFQKIASWRALYDLRPDLFNMAVDMDNLARRKLSKKRGALLETPLEYIKEMWDAQLELPLMPEPEYEYQMCECRL